MTTISFFTEGEKITGFSSEGHSGYGEVGTDVVCAAISAAVTMAECTLNDVLGVGAKVRIDEDAARVTLKLPAESKAESASQAVLMGLMLTMSSLRDEYSDYLEVLEVEQHA
ncbi:MAG: ribosomal-processing cysteine protease Prp [Oscillospiraceae bacterium]|nr:ribosomal-processing cysteine protease Prp [Oscillospiraceae bacterium]